MSRATSSRRLRKRGRAARPESASARPATAAPAEPSAEPAAEPAAEPFDEPMLADAEAAEAGFRARPRRGAVRRPTAGPQERSRFYRLTHPRFVAEIIDELRKVVWPSRQETRNLTTVVVILAIAVGVFLGVIDFAFSKLIENVLLP